MQNFIFYVYLPKIDILDLIYPEFFRINLTFQNLEGTFISIV